MDIKQLETFVCVAHTGSMTAAAQVLYLSVPALAQQINQLEKEVHVPLFVRSPRGMSLTPAGQAFYADAQQILDLTTQSIQRCQEAGRQSAHIVRIGSVKGLVPDFYPKMQRAVRKTCPDIQLEHVEDTFEALRKALLDGQIDALEFYDSPLARHPQLQYIPLIVEGRDCLIASDNPLAKKKRLTLQDLVGCEVYVYEFARVPGLREYVQQHCPQLTIKCKQPKHVGYYSTLQLCEEGAICLIPPHCASHFSPLAAVPLDIDLTWSGGLICRHAMRRQMQTVLDASRREFTCVPSAEP